MQFETTLQDQKGRETKVRVTIAKGRDLDAVIAALANKAKRSPSGRAQMAYGAITVEVIAS